MLRALNGPPGLPVTGVSTLGIEAEAQALDGVGAQAAGGVTRGFVGSFYQDGVHLDIAFGDLKAGWQAVEKFFDDALPIHADYASMRPSHAHIGDVRSALGQHM